MTSGVAINIYKFLFPKHKTLGTHWSLLIILLSSTNLKVDCLTWSDWSLNKIEENSNKRTPFVILVLLQHWSTKPDSLLIKQSPLCTDENIKHAAIEIENNYSMECNIKLFEFHCASYMKREVKNSCSRVQKCESVTHKKELKKETDCYEYVGEVCSNKFNKTIKTANDYYLCHTWTSISQISALCRIKCISLYIQVLMIKCLIYHQLTWILKVLFYICSGVGDWGLGLHRLPHRQTITGWGIPSPGDNPQFAGRG